MMLGWNTGFTTVCSLACFASLCFGAKLISRTSPEVIQKLTSASPVITAEDAVPSVPPSPAPARVVVKPNLSSTAALEAANDLE